MILKCLGLVKSTGQKDIMEEMLAKMKKFSDDPTPELHKLILSYTTTHIKMFAAAYPQEISNFAKKEAEKHLTGDEKEKVMEHLRKGQRKIKIGSHVRPVEEPKHFSLEMNDFYL